MQLKFEKVYLRSVLLSKKRYVGYKVESATQQEPNFDAKGIEIVRRDACPIVVKMMEKVLRILFTSGSLADIQHYCLCQWTKILAGDLRLSEFIFAKEVKLDKYRATKARKGGSAGKPTSSLPPAAIVATKAMLTDRRAEPQHGERVPYVVVNGPPQSRLIDLVVSPQEFIQSASHGYILNGHYYIAKQVIPALARVLSLVNVDCQRWYLEMAKPVSKAWFSTHARRNAPQARGCRTIDQYYQSQHCFFCTTLIQPPHRLCRDCRETNAQSVQLTLLLQRRQLQKRQSTLQRSCQRCCNGHTMMSTRSNIPCQSLTCAIPFTNVRLRREVDDIEDVIEPQDQVR